MCTPLKVRDASRLVRTVQACAPFVTQPGKGQLRAKRRISRMQAHQFETHRVSLGLVNNTTGPVDSRPRRLGVAVACPPY